jgi:hypothetical protein
MAQLFKLELNDMFCAWDAAKPQRTGAPHASAILAPEGDWCLRRHTLLALSPEEAVRPEPKPWDATKNAVFLNGWVLHEKYQDLFSKHGRVVEVEKSHFDEVRFLHFTPDAIVELYGELYVVEIKGYKSETFDKMDEAGDPPQAAWHQCNLYCHLLNIPYGIILVENKNTQAYKVWCIERSKELAWPYTKRMYAVKGAIIAAQSGKGLPERKCQSLNEDRAQKCPMRDLCFTEK